MACTKTRSQIKPCTTRTPQSALVRRWSRRIIDVNVFLSTVLGAERRDVFSRRRLGGAAAPFARLGLRHFLFQAYKSAGTYQQRFKSNMDSFSCICAAGNMATYSMLGVD